MRVVMPERLGAGGGLPGDVTSFVGRRDATAEVKRALAESRLVTLTGAGGVGKSRLAVHVARELRRAFRDGVWLVELAEVQDPGMVAWSMATSLGLLDTVARDTETALADYLVDKQALVVVDNCEHVLDACRSLLMRLLPVVPGLHVLATSREPIGMNGERIWPVPPLSVPSGTDGATLKGSSRQREALMLFEERTAAAVPGFALSQDNEAMVARLCQRLDGVPLAIELAAVSLRALSLEQLLERLEDRFRLLSKGQRGAPPRHQTLRAAVDWSFELCSVSERIVWARCSVFAGEFDLEAAESVCAADGLSAEEVFTCVTGLVEKSVLTRGNRVAHARYRLLETIREYGSERLAAADEDDLLRRRHRDYYLRLAEQADAESCGSGQAEWMRRLRSERTNFWAALEYCFSVPGEARTGLRLCNALWFYWVGCGFVRDGRDWLERALAANPEPSAERARALWIMGWIAFLRGENATSRVLLEDSRDLAEQVGDQTVLTYAWQYLGDAFKWANDLPRAVEILDRVLEQRRAANQWTAPGLLIFTQRAQAAGMLQDPELATALRDECEALCASLGDIWTLSWTEWNLSVTWWLAGDSHRAALHASGALRSKRLLRDRLGTPFVLETLAWVAAAEGDAHRAALLFGALGKMWELIGRPLVDSEVLLRESAQSEARCREVLGERAYEAARQEGASMPQEEVLAVALGERRACEPAVKTRSGAVLTKRERQVAELVAAGKSNREIAAELVISQRTAESHVEHIFSKLGFTSRTQIAVWRAEHQD